MTLSLSSPRAKPRWLLLAAIVALCSLAVGSIAFANHTVVATTIPSDYFTVEDAHLANDVPGQVDLTQMGRDDTVAGTYRLFWSWDSISAWTGGGQTGDACALFDTDTDTFINYVVCARVSNFNADPNDVRIVPKSATEPVYLFACSDKKNDRCTNPSPLSSASITAGPLSPSTMNLVTLTDPFPDGESNPHDTTIRVEIPPASILGTPVLTNVCSYPSAGNGGNNNPFDCIVTPGGGFIVIVKDAGNVTSPAFTFDVNRGSELVAQRSINGSGTSNEVSLLVGTGVAKVTETNIPSTWALNSAECKLMNGNGATTGTFSSANNWVSGITVESGQVTKCTFVDRPQTGTLVVKKVVVNDNGGTKVASDFSYSLDVNATSTPFGTDPAFSADPLKGSSGNISLVAGTNFSVTEPAVSGYSTTYSVGCSGSIMSGQTSTCTITNDDQAATLIVEKVVVNDNGGTKVASDFSFKVNGGTATAFLPDPAGNPASLNGKNTLGVNAGTYSVAEPAVAGYSTTYSTDCTNVVIANGGSATCTITNDDQKAQPTGTTVQSWVLHDKLTIIGSREGSPLPAASVTFKLYSDSDCEDQVGTSETVSVSATGIAQTQTGVMVTATGFYYWMASYSGDHYNEAFDTVCGDEITQIQAKDAAGGGRNDLIDPAQAQPI